MPVRALCLLRAAAPADDGAMQTHELQAGQTLTLALPAGSRVRVLGGRVQVQRPPLWLAEHLLLRTEHWDEGQGARLASREVWTVRALEAARLQVQLPLPLWRRGWLWLGRRAPAAGIGRAHV